jgi:predicted nucleic acid-binding protein
VNAVDSSVAIPAFATWHPAHAAARAIVAGGVALPAHVALETYSVVTRLPAPHRGSPVNVLRFLRESFTGDWLTLHGSSTRELIEELTEQGISGGATYDGLIAVTVRATGARLLTRDVRARRTYELLGVDVEFVG